MTNSPLLVNDTWNSPNSRYPYSLSPTSSVPKVRRRGCYFELHSDGTLLIMCRYELSCCRL